MSLVNLTPLPFEMVAVIVIVPKSLLDIRLSKDNETPSGLGKVTPKASAVVVVIVAIYFLVN